MKLRSFRKPMPYASHLQRMLSYDPSTGVFLWKHPAGGCKAGAIAGTINAYGYRVIKIAGKEYYAHRIAYVMVYGDILGPDMDIDHANRDRSDNRIANLRAATRTQNLANSIRPRKRNNLPRGVTSDCAGYSANITVRGERIYLGYFSTPEAAHDAYLSASRTHFGEFVRA